MARLNFKGGVHPYEGRDLSRRKAIETLVPEQGEMVFPLLQHKGNPAAPVVEIGDYVRTGQLIAQADGECSANLHSSVSGQVLAIGKRETADGSLQESIVIGNDGMYEEVTRRDDRSLADLSRRKLLQIIRDAGIVGMGGAGLPTYYKYADANPRKIDTVIANGVECEPYATSDYRRILEEPWKLINGIYVALKLFPGARGYIAVTENNNEAYRMLRGLLRDDPRIYVKKVRAKYPIGSERQLIYALTGRQLNAKMLPYEIGCMVNNIDTLISINQAVVCREPLITRILTVSGDGAAHPGNFRVRIGMTYRDVLEQSGGLRGKLTEEDVLILDGGPMTGSPLKSLDVPVTKLSSSIVCLRKRRIVFQPETPCTRCGRCLSVCPENLAPMQLYKDAMAGNKPAFVEHMGLECCGCGCCSYACPSKISLSDTISRTKVSIRGNVQLSGDYGRRIVRS